MCTEKETPSKSPKTQDSSVLTLLFSHVAGRGAGLAPSRQPPGRKKGDTLLAFSFVFGKSGARTHV